MRRRNSVSRVCSKVRVKISASPLEVWRMVGQGNVLQSICTENSTTDGGLRFAQLRLTGLCPGDLTNGLVVRLKLAVLSAVLQAFSHEVRSDHERHGDHLQTDSLERRIRAKPQARPGRQRERQRMNRQPTDHL
jgi:hypothetical protein